MHELSLAESAVDLIEQAAVRDGFARVRTVFIEIGRLSCVDPEALRFDLEQPAIATRANAKRAPSDRLLEGRMQSVIVEALRSEYTYFP